jgi:sulfur carrier protein
MKITLNNRTEEFDFTELSIQQIIEIKNFTFPRVVVKLNNALIKKPQYTETIVKDNDKLEIIHLISGG